MGLIDIRKLLWVDCTAAGIVGVLMIALSGIVAPWFGVSRTLLVAMGVVNLAYGSYSFSLARRPQVDAGLTRILIRANFAWTLICLVAAAYLWAPGSRLGAAYVVVEGIVVGALAALEAKALARHRAAQESR